MSEPNNPIDIFDVYNIHNNVIFVVMVKILLSKTIVQHSLKLQEKLHLFLDDFRVLCVALTCKNSYIPL